MPGIEKRLDDLERQANHEPTRIVVIWDEEEERELLEEARRRGDVILKIEWDDPPDHDPAKPEAA